MMELRIKNMVCDRCISVVRGILSNLNLEIESVELGRAVVAGAVDDSITSELSRRLADDGFELVSDAGLKTIEAIRTAALEYATATGGMDKKLSSYITEKTGVDYRIASRLFTEADNRSIENYVIAVKIERVKEMLTSGMPVKEIAYELGYSSTAHLSRQFKDVTGITPSQFRENVKDNKRPLFRPLDKI